MIAILDERAQVIGKGIGLTALAAVFGAVSAAFSPQQAHALELAYSFETGTEGFTFNPSTPIVSVTQDTIGATEGSNSLRIGIPSGQTFVGALVGVDDFAPSIGNPPGLDYLLVDLTITESYAGVFADMGILLFGTNADGTQEGQIQFIEDRLAIGSLEPGTYENVLFDLTRGNFQPFTFEFPISFNDATSGNGSNDFVPTSLQFYFNQDSEPVTVYLDNIRTGQIFEADYNGDGAVDAADYTVWRDSFELEEPITSGASFFEGDGDQDGDVDLDDYTFWAERYGASVFSSSALGVPEPTTAWLLLAGALGAAGPRRSR